MAVVALQTDSRPLRQTLVQFPTPCFPVCVVDPRFTCSGKKNIRRNSKNALAQPGVVNLGQFYVRRHRLTDSGIGCHRYGRKSSKWIFPTKSLIRAQTFTLYSAQSAEQAETYMYLKIHVLIYHLTYICPSLFDWKENMIFEETVIFKL